MKFKKPKYYKFVVTIKNVFIREHKLMILSEQLKANLIKSCTFSASKSGGPGGQNVNKVNTKIELRFNLNDTILFTENQKQVIWQKLANRINSEGTIVLFESSERSQLKNKEKAIAKFILLIEKALTPKRKRIKTKPSVASKLKRMEGKKRKAQKKKLRQKPDL